MTKLVAKVAGSRLRRGFQDRPGHIVFPTMINAAQAAIFVAAKKQRRAPMGAMLAKQTDSAGGIAKGNQIFTKSRTRTGAQSGDGISSDNNAGIQ